MDHNIVTLHCSPMLAVQCQPTSGGYTGIPLTGSLLLYTPFYFYSAGKCFNWRELLLILGDYCCQQVIESSQDMLVARWDRQNTMLMLMYRNIGQCTFKVQTERAENLSLLILLLSFLTLMSRTTRDYLTKGKPGNKGLNVMNVMFNSRLQ